MDSNSWSPSHVQLRVVIDSKFHTIKFKNRIFISLSASGRTVAAVASISFIGNTGVVAGSFAVASISFISNTGVVAGSSSAIVVTALGTSTVVGVTFSSETFAMVLAS